MVCSPLIVFDPDAFRMSVTRAPPVKGAYRAV